MASTALTTGSAVAPMRQRQSLEFPYKHSTGETIGRFLAGLKEQKKIWGQRVNGQGVVVPPLGYSEIDGSAAGEWVEVKNTGVITAAARVDHPIERLHPSTTPFAFVLVKLDGADTALAHIVTEDLDRVAVGARVEAVWASDESRVGSIRDIACFRVVADAPPAKLAGKVVSKPAAKAKSAAPAKVAAAAKTARTKKTAKTKRAAKTAKTIKTVVPKKKKKPAVAKKSRNVARAKPTKATRAKKQRSTKKTAKSTRAKKTKRLRHR